MKNAEFVVLLSANTNKTKNLRTFAGNWKTGAARLPNEITTRIGCIIALLQKRIDEGYLCNSATEGVLVYNFQPVLFRKDKLFCSLDMLIKPLLELDCTHLKSGVPVSVIIEANTTEVCNCSKGMLDVGLITPEEIINEKLDQPIVYGLYSDFEALSGYVALISSTPLPIHKLFVGELDDQEAVQQARGFYSAVEAAEYINGKGEYACVAELTCSKEKLPELKQKKLVGKSLVKLYDCNSKEISITSNPSVQSEEARIEDQIGQLQHALTEPVTQVLTPDMDEC